MTEEHAPRRRGPWDREPVTPETPVHDPASGAGQSRGQSGDQSLPWAIGSTLIFVAFLWWAMNSLILAVAVLFGVVVHEYGHVLAMNRVGMGPARFYIVPFLGGVARGQRPASSEWRGVLVSLAGPVFGLLATLPLFGLFFVLGDPIWLAAAFLIALFNLLNLAPAPPLDGSRAIGPVLARIHPWLEVGALLLIGATVVVWALMNRSYILAAFLLLALFGHLRRGVRPPEGRPLSVRESLQAAGLFGASAALCAGVAAGAATLLAGDPVAGVQQLLSAFGLTR